MLAAVSLVSEIWRTPAFIERLSDCICLACRLQTFQLCGHGTRYGLNCAVHFECLGSLSALHFFASTDSASGLTAAFLMLAKQS